jgi:hypothetical protein
MADGPWRCSQCGTINEPVANSCRTCGRWPSLFDLQDSIVDEADLEGFRERAPAEPEVFEPETFETETVDTETFEPEPFDTAPFEREADERVEPEADGGRRAPRWTSAIIPIAVVVYFVISFFFSDR